MRGPLGQVLGALAKFYPSRGAGWWFGGGAQWDHATSGSIKFGGEPEDALRSNELPNFAFTYGAVGANFPLFGNFYLIPDLRVGALLVSKPLIIEADAQLSVGYAF